MSWAIVYLAIGSIHDPSAVQDFQGDHDSAEDSSGYSSQETSEPPSKADESHDQNIYPITWRVIGGGVMMGGQSTYTPRVLPLCMLITSFSGEVCTRYKDEVCPDGDDCPHVHPWEGSIGPLHASESLPCSLALLNDDETDETRTPIEATSSHTSTPRASHFPPEMADTSTAILPSSPVPELIPDIYPVAARGCRPSSILGVREELPPRPFSTPPRINSRAEAAATSMKTCVALSIYGTHCRDTHAIFITTGTVHEKSAF